jgi:hypothetical protein
VTRLSIESWAAVAPGLEGEGAWRDWARAPEPLRGEAHPDVSFLPPMLRRRCDTLSRMMLAAVNACCGDEQRSRVPSVFASRHGSFAATVAMLEELARDEPLSPTRFSHSVHNTQAGLFSIWAGNEEVAQSLASRNDTFEHGFLEALCLLARSEGRVLFVTGDEALPEPVAHLSSDPAPPYALALLLAPAGGPGLPVELDLVADAPAKTGLGWPKALEFLRWWLAEESEPLRLGTPPRSFVWRRVGAQPAQKSKKLNH